jgi:hypothetical protein
MRWLLLTLRVMLHIMPSCWLRSFTDTTPCESKIVSSFWRPSPIIDMIFHNKYITGVFSRRIFSTIRSGIFFDNILYSWSKEHNVSSLSTAVQSPDFSLLNCSRIHFAGDKDDLSINQSIDFEPQHANYSS